MYFIFVLFLNPVQRYFNIPTEAFTKTLYYREPSQGYRQKIVLLARNLLPLESLLLITWARTRSVLALLLSDQPS